MRSCHPCPKRRRSNYMDHLRSSRCSRRRNRTNKSRSRNPDENHSQYKSSILLVAFNRLGGKKAIAFFLRRQKSFRQSAPVVIRHTIFPLEKIGDGLRLNANFHTAEAGEKQIHFMTESRRGT